MQHSLFSYQILTNCSIISQVKLQCTQNNISLSRLRRSGAVWKLCMRNFRIHEMQRGYYNRARASTNVLNTLMNNSLRNQTDSCRHGVCTDVVLAQPDDTSRQSSAQLSNSSTCAENAETKCSVKVLAIRAICTPCPEKSLQFFVNNFIKLERIFLHFWNKWYQYYVLLKTSKINL